MLTITPAQYGNLSRDYMLRRTHAFLRERTQDAEVQALLAQADQCHAFWTPLYEEIHGADEHAVAVRLSYALAAQVHDGQPGLASQPGNDAEIAMKTRLEQWGVLPFAAFD